MIEIPENVIDALEFVRNTGETNMFDRNMVIRIAYDDEQYEAALWLNDNPKLYSDALNALGKRIANRD